MRKRFKIIHFLILMAGLGLIFPLVAFYLGDDFIMNMAECYMKQGDVSQAMTYYDRLEAFIRKVQGFPRSSSTGRVFCFKKTLTPGVWFSVFPAVRMKYKIRGGHRLLTAVC